MIIERRLTPYLVFAEDSVLVALRKMTENKDRIVFCVDSRGQLHGSISDGDFRRWIIANPQADLEVASAVVANRDVVTLPFGADTAEILAALPVGAAHLPLLDERGRLAALAINKDAELRIGEHAVGPGQPCFVIAEIGNNHNGSVDLARELVDRAAEAGAQAVKFQLRDMGALYRQTGSAGEDLGVQYTLDLLTKFALPAPDLLPVFDHARDRGLAVMCTPWDSPSVKALADYGVDALKIASADLTNHDLLKDAGSHRLPMVLSTGMSREEEIRESVDLVRSLGVPFALLHCQSTYPAPFKDINLAYMDRLGEIGGCPIGYSGHERGIHVPVAAVARGAKIIEKHLTWDRAMEGNDHKVSLLSEEFSRMTAQIREVEASLGSTRPRVVSTGEAMNRINLSKSLVASRQLEPGHVVGEADVEVKSPGRGLQPNSRHRLIGRTLHRSVGQGEFFFEGDLHDVVPTARQFHFDRPWGLPVRYHDIAALTTDCTPDFLEFHFSYKDLEIDPADVLPQALTGRSIRAFTTHLPDLFAGDFLVDLASRDAEHRAESIRQVQRTIDVTRALSTWFPDADDEPLMVVTMGGFTTDRHLGAGRRAPAYERVAEALGKLDTTGVRIAAQTLPPYPWLMGGQQFHNLFLDPADTAEFARTTGTGLCLDISHTKLAVTFLGLSLSEAVEQLAPYTTHLHLVDAVGVDGEGVQIGEGEVDWPALASQLRRSAPGVPFIPEIWQGHVNGGAGFWTALERLEEWL
ncbi:acetylneuraminic acid synthetase [Kocuria soli]|uniref:Acetylneuraminic acid synthetase n=1 Tax=Kocuria soli TaxID=2485125 RepID=A0A3N3ZTD0_9MICC|nr:N-acetylneuraminate synthase family protein [Kocuria soli]ROZ63038.1 acetylneuraminic acid synthetase [Kocuria soli]